MVSRIEFEQLLKSGRKPNIGLVEAIPLNVYPHRADFSPNLQELVAVLKNTAFISRKGYDLIPLTGKDVFPFSLRLYDAWQKEFLRSGYLQSLPRDFLPILDIAKNWKKNPESITYRLTHSTQVNTICYLHVLFNQLKDQGITAWISYGNIQPNSIRMHHMTNGLALLIHGLHREVWNCGYRLSSFMTTVSNRNTGSVRVLANNGFQIDPTRKITPSPIALGGQSYPVRLDL